MNNNKYSLLENEDQANENQENIPMIMEEDDLEMLASVPQLKQTRSFAHQSELEHRLHIQSINNRTSSFGPEQMASKTLAVGPRMKKINEELDPTNLSLIKKVSDGYNVKHHQILKDLILSQTEINKN